VAAVMSTRAILIGNASAYVSSISTPLISIKIPHLLIIAFEVNLRIFRFGFPCLFNLL
jgi:hypothetical protein